MDWRVIKRAYSLADAGDAAVMQAVYELAVGTVIRMDCQLNVVAFHFQPAASAPDHGKPTFAGLARRSTWSCSGRRRHGGGMITIVSTRILTT